MSASTANLTRYTRVWLERRDSKSSDRRGANSQRRRNRRLCYRAIQSLPKGTGRPLHTAARYRKEELAKLYLWGQSLGSEYLDTALGYSEDLCFDVLEAVASIGKLSLQGERFNSNKLANKLAELIILTEMGKTLRTASELGGFKG